MTLLPASGAGYVRRVPAPVAIPFAFASGACSPLPRQWLVLEAVGLVGPLLEKRRRAIRSACQELEAARSLGDRSTDLELTRLWARVVPLLWRRSLTENAPRQFG